MKRGQVRIIGGQWRGRRCRVPDVAGLRPTPDRVRETLFNWLGSGIVGARCLDAFAGTGVLGFEAASRGALQVVLTEVSSLALQELKRQVDSFAADNMVIHRGAQPGILTHIPGSFDVVFLDPPWQQSGLWLDTLTALIAMKKLSHEARIYVETPASLDAGLLPEGLRILKTTRAGEVHGTLLVYEGGAVASEDPPGTGGADPLASTWES